MTQLLQFGLVLFAGACVAVADVLLKRASVSTHSFMDAIRNPLVVLAVFLYVCQIAVFTYVFVKRWELGLVGILQMVCYAVIVIVCGVAIFHEKLSFTHTVGLVAALVGVVFMNV